MRPHTDQYLAAVHECAHAAVTAHFGGCGSVSIWPVPTADLLHERGWTGCFTTYAAPGSVEIPDGVREASGIVEAPPNWQALVSLAGTIAEVVVATEGPLKPHDIVDCFTNDDLSDTDRAGAAGWTDEDLETCVSLVQRLLPQIKERAFLAEAEAAK